METKRGHFTFKNKLLKELKILLVEDEYKLSSLLKNAIGDNFYSFTIADNGEEGIEKFKKITPDIVITDIMMPKLTGLEMAKEMKKINPDIAIIILSAFSETDKLLNAIDVGVVKYFIKPFDPQELLEYIEEVAQKFENRNIELINGFSFNQTKNNLYKNGRYIAMTAKEKIFIQLLLQTQQTSETIKMTFWPQEDVSDDRVRSFIKRLREKTSKGLIKNTKGMGYEIQFKSSKAVC